ncbi:MAG: PHB depolymerase family esterase [Planctomycetia bacterium]|nr:PHB depolymerase family esterase [Planctomycetia bacterium]
MKIFMSRLTLFIACCLASGAFSSADAAQFPDKHALFEKVAWNSSSGGVLLYRMYSPELKPGEKYPLIIFLHGAGERGSNNETQFIQDHFLNLVFGEKGQPAFVIVPQCPVEKRWCEVDWSIRTTHETPETPSDPLRMVYELLQELKKNAAIDADRIYITGLSMGGFGTFDFLVRYPEEVAAAVPVCGGGDNEKLRTMPELKSIPVWIFHGDADGAVAPDRSRGAFKALKENGVDVTYTEYPNVGHNSWVRAYNTDELVDWLFKQRKVR